MAREGMGMFSMVRGKQVVVLLFASITALAMAGAGQAQEVGFAERSPPTT